jgi:hypothetical protein
VLLDTLAHSVMVSMVIIAPLAMCTPDRFPFRVLVAYFARQAFCRTLVDEMGVSAE